ncbi:EpsG family protein [uncultured Clostridium sp.]|uniref:EpsG family protein n=1 Tax=uncultured Clostridium sp. TaxID=59620 RepID=UPI0025F5E204|nr:EpsG family protein [uncultured Clostridium sp.]
MDNKIILIFLILCIDISIIEIITKKSMKFMFWIISIFFMLIVAYRSLKVPDTLAYIMEYKNIDNDIYYSYFEKGFIFISKIINIIVGADYKKYFFCIALINIILIRRVIKNYLKFSIVTPLVLYISFYGFYFNAIILRAGLAFSFILLAWIVFDKNKIKACIFFVIAILLHSSSIFAVIGLVVFKMKKEISTRSYYIWLAIIGIFYFLKLGNLYSNILISFVDAYISNNRFIYYIENMQYDNGISLRFILNYLIAIICVMYRKGKDEKYINLLNIYMIGLTITAMLSNIMLIQRVTDFFIAINFILLAVIIENSKYKIKWITIYTISVTLNAIFVLRIINI